MWIIRVAKEVVLGDWLHLVVEEFEGMLIRKLHDVVLERANVLKELG